MLVFALLQAAFLGVISAQHWEPWKRCWTCVSRERILDPGFGIELSTSYLTAAVRHHNASVSELVKITGSSKYQELMRNLDARDADLRGQSSQRQQLLLNDISEPPAGTVGRMLTTLKQAVLAKYQLEVKSALILVPNLAHLQEPSVTSLLIDAMHLAPMSPLPGHADSALRPTPVGAAAAANGLGLCNTYTKLDECGREEDSLPSTEVLGIEYTNTSLAVFLSGFRASREGLDIINTRKWELGHAHRSTESTYWQQVKQTIQEVPLQWPNKHITDIILLGESSLEPDFLEVLREALHEVLPDWNGRLRERAGSNHLDGSQFIDPTFAAARGAAEFAKRIMEAPDGCLEPQYCKVWRKLIG